MAEFEIQDFMATIDMQNLVPPDPTRALTGGITDVKVEEADENGVFQENTVIRIDRDWQVSLSWKLQGILLSSKNFTFPGKWVVSAFLEAWGENAKDKDLPVVSLAVEQEKSTEWKYNSKISVTKGTVDQGAYRLAVTLTYQDDDGNPGPIAGFIEVPTMIQIYKPSK